jgi:predicted porin
MVQRLTFEQQQFSPKTMKKALVILVAATVGTTSLIAQDETGVRFGMKLSPNLGFVNPDTRGYSSSGSNAGYTFGLMAEFPIGTSGNYQFATGLNLNNVSGAWKETYTYAEDVTGPTRTRDLETNVKLRYIELPLTIKMMTNEIGYMRYFGQVGFGNAVNIRAKADIIVPTIAGTRTDGTAIVTEFTELENEDMQDNISPYKASLIVAAGMEYNFSGNTSLLVAVTYNNGFTDILKTDDIKAMANYLELTVGIFF